MTKFTNFKILCANKFDSLLFCCFTVISYFLKFRYIIWVVYCLFMFMYFQDILNTVSYCDDGSTINTNNTSTVQVDGNEGSEKGWHKIPNLYHNIKNSARRRLFWEFCEVDRDNYSSYKEFKKHWNKNINITSEIKKDFKNDLEKLKVIKHTIAWIFNRRES